MANPNSDKPRSRNTIIACTLAILITHLALVHNLLINYKNNWFFVIDMLLLTAFVIASIAAYKKADEKQGNFLRGVVIAIAILSSVWGLGWSVWLNDQTL